MSTLRSHNVLAQQIQRLMISSAERKRLLEEMQQLGESGEQQLAKLLEEHDQEALQVLNEKAGEIEAVKGRISANWPPEAQQDEVQTIAAQIREMFSQPEKLAQFIAASDDLTLKKLEEILAAGIDQKPELLNECHNFFNEIRLQKAAFVKSDEEEQKRLLAEAIMSRKEQNDRLDSLISEAKKLLASENKK